MKKLKEFKKKSKRSYPDMAKEVGVSTSQMYFYTFGRSIPSVKIALKIEKMSGGFVSVYDWGK